PRALQQRSSHRLGSTPIYVVLNRCHRLAVRRTIRVLLYEPVPNEKKLIQWFTKRRGVIAIDVRKVSCSRHGSARYESRSRQFNEGTPLANRHGMWIGRNVVHEFAGRRCVRYKSEFRFNLGVLREGLRVAERDRGA